MTDSCRYFFLKAISLIMTAVFIPLFIILFIIFVIVALPFVVTTSIYMKTNDALWRMKNRCK